VDLQPILTHPDAQETGANHGKTTPSYSSAFKAKVVLTAIKYERLYLHVYEPTSEVKLKIGQYFDYSNRRRPHSKLDWLPPDRFYFNSLCSKEAA